MEFFFFLILFLCVFMPTWNLLCQTSEYIKDKQRVVETNMDTVDRLYDRIVNVASRVINRLHIGEYLRAASQYAQENPITALCIGIAIVIFAVPFITCVGFVVVTLGFTFLGFIFVNGTVLVVAALALGGVVVTLATIALFIGTCIAAISVAISEAYSYYNKTFGQRSPNRTPRVTSQNGHQKIGNGTIRSDGVKYSNGFVNGSMNDGIAAH